MEIKHIKTHEIILSALFIALITVGSYIRIPIFIVHFTLQFMFVMLAGQLLKCKTAAVCLLLYTALGILGLPVFSGGGGIGYLLQPTFGYIIGFNITAVLISAISHRGKPTFLRLLMANAAGYVALYICGIGYYLLLNIFYFGKYVDISALLLTGLVVFIPTDFAFCVLTAVISKRIRPLLLKLKA